jgi:predicted ester cyclase
MAGPNGSRAWALAQLWEAALARFTRQAESRPARTLRPGHPHTISSFPARPRQKEQSVRSGGLRVIQHKGLSRRLYEEVFGLGRLEAADEILSPDCVSHGPGTPPTIGTDGIKRQATILRTAFPDLRVSLDDQLAEGDRVASRWTGSGTHSGPLTLPAGPLPPTGARIAFGEIRIDRFADGRIVESWFLPDRFTLWQQLGLLPAAPPPRTKRDLDAR